MTDAASLPRYLQIAERVTREIRSGLWADGARLPPERALAVEVGAAVGTVRKALAELERRGLIVRRRGSGSYVRRPLGGGAPESIYALFGLERTGGGGLPTAEVLSVEQTPAPGPPPPPGRRTRAAAGPRAHRIRRLRRLDGQPAAVEEIWLDTAVAAEIDAQALPEALYLHYRTALGLIIARAEDRIGVAPAPGWAPGVFAPRPGQSCGFVWRTAFAAASDQAVEWSRTWFDPSVAAYVARLREET